MDLVWILEWFGEPQTLLLSGSVIGLVFGAVAQRSGFCTRSAIIDLVDRGGRASFALWFAALAVAIAASQLLLATGQIDLAETRFFSTPQSLSGAILGGTLFGTGMILARGCVSRQLVLGASGNLRALASVAVIAVAAFVTIEGFGSDIRFAINGAWSTASTGGNGILALVGADQMLGVTIGAVLVVLSSAIAVRTRLGVAKMIAGLLIGLTIPAGWYLTYSLSLQVFEPVQATSLTYISPFSNIAGFASDGDVSPLLSAEVGFVAGTFGGALIAALASGSFSVQTFSSPDAAPVWRYAVGAVLMGFGGVLAAGCTIGAGFTGGSVLALASVAAFFSMIVSAAITHKLIDRATVGATDGSAAIVPAE